MECSTFNYEFDLDCQHSHVNCMQKYAKAVLKGNDKHIRSVERKENKAKHRALQNKTWISYLFILFVNSTMSD